MKVLFWIQPITEHAWPSQKEGWVTCVVPEILRQLGPAEVMSCLSKDLKDILLQRGFQLPGKIVTFNQSELLDGYRRDSKRERERYILTGVYSEFYQHLESVVRLRIPTSYVPDIIFSFNESPFLRRIFPNALHLSCEMSIFSRIPYPSLLAFDPISDGCGSRFVIARFADKINAVPASDEDRASMRILRDAMVNALKTNDFVGNYFSGIRKEYDRIVLIPLGADNYFDTLPGMSYTNQFEFVEHVLACVDQKTCVVVTQHPIISAIHSRGINDLKTLYPNFRNELWFGSMPCFSQIALPYVDVCVCSQTSVAYQAAFLGKYLVSPDGFCKGIADSTNIADINNLFDSDPVDRTNYFVWVLKRYAIELGQLGSFLRLIAANRGSFASANMECWPEVLTSVQLRQKVDGWVDGLAKPFGQSLSTMTPVDCIWSDIDLVKNRLVKLNEQLASAQQEVLAKVAQLDEVRNSRSWRITKPLRFVGKIVRFLKNPSGYQFPECDDDSLVERYRLSVKVGGLLSRDAIRSVYLMSGRSTLGVSKYMVYAFHQLRENARQYNSVRNDCRRKALACTSSSHTHRLMSAVIKPIALYLPQYHRIPENDKWWGEGFTEWTNVKKAKPLFKGHYQPHVPHKDIGYYDLSDVNVMRKQAAMAKKYGIYGFCFYYYHFANGKRLLEKPINNYLAAKDIDFPFCFCWANENWTRRWDGGENDVIMPQDYGRENMMNMFRDMLVAFKDPRYIKVGDHKDVPVLLIYRPEIIPDIKAVILEWRRVAKASGFKDLYLIGCQNFKVMDFRELGLDASYSFYVPCTTADSHRVDGHELCISSYDSMMDATWRDENVSYPRYRIVTPSWDNSPRRGVSGAIMVGSTPKKFKQHFEDVCYQTLADDKTRENGFVFINAWNEWAEGAHLEPDEKNGYAYLKAVSEVMKARVS